MFYKHTPAPLAVWFNKELTTKVEGRISRQKKCLWGNKSGMGDSPVGQEGGPDLNRYREVKN